MTTSGTALRAVVAGALDRMPPSQRMAVARELVVALLERDWRELHVEAIADLIGAVGVSLVRTIMVVRDRSPATADSLLRAMAQSLASFKPESLHPLDHFPPTEPIPVRGQSAP